MLDIIIILLVIVVLQMVLGMLWYSPLLFGKIWMKINKAEHYTKEELKAMQKKMLPFYALQFLMSFVVAFTTFTFLISIPNADPISVVLWSVFGFIIPTQISAVIWGSTEKKFWLKQILIMSGYQIVAGAVIVSVFYLANYFI